ncbi:hypothetical protein [Planotetraspora sp. GP83]|uniref:hypothetical protein n=1 Tax=Planotetraspora sp. GP83 TaxID=3156264 RepID=UPI0035115A40
MSRRATVWAGLVSGVGALIALAVYLGVVGLDSADKTASIIGLFVGLAGLFIAARSLRAEPPENESAQAETAAQTVQKITARGQGTVAQGVMFGNIVNHGPGPVLPPNAANPVLDDGQADAS